MRGKLSAVLLISIPMLLGLPILGVVFIGIPVNRYLEFPPETRFIKHPPFSWKVFLAYLVIIVGLVLPFARRAAAFARNEAHKRIWVRHFPWWGWVGIAAMISFWLLAWTRFCWFSRFQPHTFAPLWVSFIVLINAVCFWRTGRSLMTHDTGFFLTLFPCSAAFWWFFEYLNRFVQNWHYTGVKFCAFSYALYASISFSTVLPAVLSVRALVLEFGWIQRGFARWIEFGAVSHRVVGFVGLVGGALALFLVGIVPNVLFSMLWVAPLVVIVSVQILTGQRHVFSGLGRGDWREPISAACAALICGWFWEMWNYLSLARWEYTIAFVDRFHIFEMPILGYAGYLPFGIECVVVGGLLKDLLGSPQP